MIRVQKKTKSLVKFLEALKREPEYLTRSRYIGLCKNSSLTNIIEQANKSFDKLAGNGNNSYPASLIDKDIRKLTKEGPCKKIFDFRHDYVAHKAKNKRPAPTEGDLFKAFKVIEDIMKKYNSLLKANSVLYFTPEIQSDWEEVFTIPWIVRRPHDTN